MKKSKRVITNTKIPKRFFLSILVVSLIPLSIWLWQKTSKEISVNGPQFIGDRIEQAIGRPVHLAGTSLTFPSKITFEDLAIFQKDSSNILLKTPQLEIDISILSLFTGKIRPQKIKVVSPQIAIFRTDNGPLNIGDSADLSKIVTKFSAFSSPQPSKFSLFSWPIAINPGIIEIIDGKVHLEDELDKFPQLNGNFKLLIERSTQQEQLALVNAMIKFNKTQFFYHGLHGTLSGTAQLTPQEISSRLTIDLIEGGPVNLTCRVNNYQASPQATFEIKAESFDLKNLALIKFPLFKLSPQANVNGTFKITTPTLYGRPLESFSTAILFNKGVWRVDAIDMQLTNNNGKISGSIVPLFDNETKLATATLLYQGTMAPSIQLKNSLINELSPSAWSPPITISSKMIINFAAYPPQITEMKLTSNNGDLFTKGTVDLFSGFATMRGTYLKSSNLNNYTQTSPSKVSAVDVIFTGPIITPEIFTPPAAEN